MVKTEREGGRMKKKKAIPSVTTAAMNGIRRGRRRGIRRGMRMGSRRATAIRARFSERVNETASGKRRVEERAGRRVEMKKVVRGEVKVGPMEKIERGREGRVEKGGEKRRKRSAFVQEETKRVIRARMDGDREPRVGIGKEGFEKDGNREVVEDGREKRTGKHELIERGFTRFGSHKSRRRME